jgi:uncharacterized protein YuzE
MRNSRYRHLLSDPCAYIQWHDGKCVIIIVWIDDLLLFVTTIQMMDKMKATIKSEWVVIDLGEPSKIVGIEITARDDAITISQQKYIKSILAKEGMSDANPVGTPMDLKEKIRPNPEYREPNQSNSYAGLVGKIQYVANATCLDISYTINKLASYTANPST